MTINKLSLLAAGLLASNITLADGFTVSGEVSFPAEGAVLLELVNKEQFTEGKNGDHGTGFAGTGGSGTYTFENVPAGDYVLQGFQDVNGNGELDSGAFGPTEPWVIHGYKPSAFSGPDFDKAKITVNADAQINIKLKK